MTAFTMITDSKWKMRENRKEKGCQIEKIDRIKTKIVNSFFNQFNFYRIRTRYILSKNICKKIFNRQGEVRTPEIPLEQYPSGV